MKFEINEHDLRLKAKASCEIEKGIVTPEREEFWYNYALNDVLAKELSKKTNLSYNVILQDISKFSKKYKDLLVSFINDEIHYQGKYWSFEELYAFVENWQMKKYGNWGMFCKVLTIFENTEQMLQDKEIPLNKIDLQRDQVIGAIQSIGTIL